LLKGKEIPLTHPYAENSRGLGVADMARAITNSAKARVGAELSCHVLDIMTSLQKSAEDGVERQLQTTCDIVEPMPMDIEI
jgi:hypothetical protein